MESNSWGWWRYTWKMVLKWTFRWYWERECMFIIEVSWYIELFKVVVMLIDDFGGDTLYSCFWGFEVSKNRAHWGGKVLLQRWSWNGHLLVMLGKRMYVHCSGYQWQRTQVGGIIIRRCSWNGRMLCCDTGQILCTVSLQVSLRHTGLESVELYFGVTWMAGHSIVKQG